MVGKITELTDIGADLAGTDLIEVVDDPAGVPFSRKSTISRILTYIEGAATAFATAVQGAKADTALQPGGDLGTPSAGVATNLTGTAAGLTAGEATNIAGGAGGQVPYQSAAGTTALLLNGTAGQVLTSAGTTLAPTWEDAASGSGDALTTNPLSQFAATTSLQLAGVLSDETGSGAAVFANSPTLDSPTIDTKPLAFASGGGSSTPSVTSTAGAFVIYSPSGAAIVTSSGNWATIINENGINIFQGDGLRFSSGNLVYDTALERDGTGTLGMRKTTTSHTLNCYNTYTNSTNYERLALKGSGEVAVETAGTGTDDIDLALTPAGAGNVKFGSHTAVGAETVTGYIEIKDSAGTVRKLAVLS